MEAFHTITTILTIKLGSIAGVSQLVGGVGIMNIMLMAVVERTREIGQRKAEGAGDSAILLQFVSEASVLLLGGSVVGVLMAYAGAAGLAWGYPTFAAGVTLDVDACFGVYPAAQAAQLDPSAALRHE